jgi:hypothetical protein
VLVIGIDPGKSGGIAWCGDDGVVSAVKMPETETDVTEFLRKLSYIRPAFTETRQHVVVYLERVASFPGDGGAAMFTFGRGFGYLLGTLAAFKCPVVEVLPLKWKRTLSVLPTKNPKPDSESDEQRRRRKYEHKTKLKKASKDKAQKLFPHLKITHMTSEALLIMEYGRITEGLKHGG